MNTSSPAAAQTLAADTALVRSYLDRINSREVEVLSDAVVRDYKLRILDALHATKACLVAHYYTDPILQDLCGGKRGLCWRQLRNGSLWSRLRSANACRCGR